MTASIRAAIPLGAVGTAAALLAAVAVTHALAAIAGALAVMLFTVLSDKDYKEGLEQINQDLLEKRGEEAFTKYALPKPSEWHHRNILH